VGCGEVGCGSVICMAAGNMGVCIVVLQVMKLGGCAHSAQWQELSATYTEMLRACCA
jgi:hypothetical protein